MVQDRLLQDADKSPAAFAFGLARGIRRLRTGCSNNNGHHHHHNYDDDDDDDDDSGEGISARGRRRRRLLRVSASCVSKALQSGESINLGLGYERDRGRRGAERHQTESRPGCSTGVLWAPSCTTCMRMRLCACTDHVSKSRGASKAPLIWWSGQRGVFWA